MVSQSHQRTFPRTSANGTFPITPPTNARIPFAIAEVLAYMMAKLKEQTRYSVACPRVDQLPNLSHSSR